MQNTLSELNICTTHWNGLVTPKFKASAFHICDFTNDDSISETPYSKLEAVIFVGSYTGEIVRYILQTDQSYPSTCSFGHNTKIVQFAECTLPVIQNGILSLSYDGTVCVWSVLDGICYQRFHHILPKGCQRIACANTAIEIAAISGAFPNIYILNLQTGEIISQIRPIPKFPVCLEFYSEGDAEWLFALGANGCASFTSLTPKTASSNRFGLFNPEDEFLLDAIPSPDFNFLILIYSHGYVLVGLFSPSFPKYARNDCPNIRTAVWCTKTQFALIQFDGSFSAYELTPPSTEITPDIIIKSITYKTSTYIKSSLMNKNSEEIFEFKRRLIQNVQPLNQCPLTTKKLQMFQAIEKLQNIESSSPPEKVQTGEDGALKIKNKTKKSKFGFKKLLGKDKKDKVKSVQADEIQEGAKTVNTNHNDISSFEDTEYVFDPIFKCSAQSSISFPFISVFHEDLAFAFDSCVILAAHNCQEYNTVAMSTNRNDGITSQCYYINHNKVKSLFQGTVKGGILVDDWKGETMKEKDISNEIVSMFAKKHWLFVSSKNCILTVYLIDQGKQSQETVWSFSHFVSPVTKFFMVSKKTKTSIDNCVFCLTSDGVISVVDISKKHPINLFILTGHESAVEKIYFHPPTKLVLVQCRSLYFWSMITGNLESIMNGHQMFKYIHDAKDTLIEITEDKEQSNGLQPYPVTFGNLNLQIMGMNIVEIAEKIHSVYSSRKDFEKIPNIPFILNVLSKQSISVITERYNNISITKDMTIGFSGKGNVLTACLQNLKGKSKWQISPQVTSLIIALRIILCSALQDDPYIKENWSRFLNLAPDVVFTDNLNYHSPDLFYLLKYLVRMETSVHKYLFDIIKRYTINERKEWLENIMAILDTQLFPNHRTIFELLSFLIKATFFNELPEQQLKEFALALYNHQNSYSNASFTRDLIVFCRLNQQSILNCFDKEQLKRFLFNIFQFSDSSMHSSPIDYLVTFISSNSISTLSSLPSSIKTDSNWPNLIANFKRAMILSKKALSVIVFAKCLCESLCLFYQTGNKKFNDLISTINVQNEIVCFRFFKNDGIYIVFSVKQSEKSILWVYKLGIMANSVNNSSTADQNIASSKSHPNITSSPPSATKQTATPPAQTNKPIRSKSSNLILNEKMSNNSTPNTAASNNSSANTWLTEKIELPANQIHDICFWNKSKACFVASGNKVLKVAISFENKSSDYDPTVRKLFIKLSLSSQKEFQKPINMTWDENNNLCIVTQDDTPELLMTVNPNGKL